VNDDAGSVDYASDPSCQVFDAFRGRLVTVAAVHMK